MVTRRKTKRARSGATGRRVAKPAAGRRSRRRLWLAVIAAAIVAATVTIVLVVTSGPSGPSGRAGNANHAASAPRPVTGDEANRLAVMRFENYRTGLHFRTTTNAALALTGDLDYHRHLGYATAIDAGQPSAVQWNASRLLAWSWPRGAPAGEPPATLPSNQPRVRALDATKNDLDTLLTILLALGQDRPDNAALIRQDGAMFVRTDVVGAVPVDVLQGPRTSGAGTASSNALTYWVDAAGHLRRVDIVLGRSPHPVRIDTDPALFRSFPASPLLTPGS
jgi:hypothetical protein